MQCNPNRAVIPGITSPDLLLNTTMILESIQIVKVAMRGKLQGQNLYTPATEGVIESAYQIFKATLTVSTGPFRRVICPTIKPEFLVLPIFQIFIIYVEDCLQRLLIQCPQNSELNRRWSDCRTAIVNYRYDNDLQALQRILDFVEFIQNQLRLYGQEGEAAQQQEGAFWDAWRQLFNHADILEFTYANLYACNEDARQRTPVSVQLLVDCYSLISRRLNQDLSWMLQEFETSLRPYENDPQHPSRDHIMKVMALLRQLRQELLPQTQKLLCDDVPTICSDHALVKKIKANLQDRSEGSWGDFLGDTGIIHQALEELSRYMQNNHYVVEGVVQLHRVKLPPNINTKLLPNFSQPTIPLADLQKTIDYLGAHSRCHRLWDTYINSRIVTLELIGDYLGAWQNHLKKSHRLTDALKKLAIARFGPPPPKKPLSEEELNKLIAEVDQPKKASGGKPKKENREPPPAAAASSSSSAKKKDASKAREPKEPAVGREPLPTLAKPIAKAAPIPRATLEVQEREWDPYSRALVCICTTFQAQEHQFKRVAIRQALMTAQDLHVLRRRLEGPLPKMHHLALASAIWQSSYRHLEQVLRYTLLVQKYANDPQEKLAMHHLLWFEGQVALPGGVNRDVLRRLFLANMWDDLTYEQHAQRSQLLRHRQVLPEVLQDARRLTENEGAPETVQVVSALPRLVSDVFTFAHQVQLDSGLRGPSEPNPKKQVEMRFDVDWRGSAEGFRLIEAAVKAFLGKYDQSSTHPAALKLRQLLKDLKVLEGNICRLRESISSLEFSLAVRNICHWEHAIAQQMLQALVYLKTGDDLGAKHEHELAAIYRAMPWTQGPNEGEVQFLEEYFRDIHRVSFYPFDAREIACRLHHAVLAAEMLREHPISQIGFQDQGTTKGQAVTPLNFIPVDPALLKVEEVMGVLATAHSRLMTMMTQRCLPELKMLMQN